MSSRTIRSYGLLTEENMERLAQLASAAATELQRDDPCGAVDDDRGFFVPVVDPSALPGRRSVNLSTDGLTNRRSGFARLPLPQPPR